MDTYVYLMYLKKNQYVHDKYFFFNEIFLFQHRLKDSNYTRFHTVVKSYMEIQYAGVECEKSETEYQTSIKLAVKFRNILDVKSLTHCSDFIKNI